MKRRHWLLICAGIVLLYPLSYATNTFDLLNLVMDDAVVSGSFMLIVALLAAWTVLEVVARLPFHAPSACRACGYDLSSQKCPECGAKRNDITPPKSP